MYPRHYYDAKANQTRSEYAERAAIVDLRLPNLTLDLYIYLVYAFQSSLYICSVYLVAHHTTWQSIRARSAPSFLELNLGLSRKDICELARAKDTELNRKLHIMQSFGLKLEPRIASRDECAAPMHDNIDPRARAYIVYPIVAERTRTLCSMRQRKTNTYEPYKRPSIWVCGIENARSLM